MKNKKKKTSFKLDLRKSATQLLLEMVSNKEYMEKTMEDMKKQSDFKYFVEHLKIIAKND